MMEIFYEYCTVERFFYGLSGSNTWKISRSFGEYKRIQFTFSEVFGMYWVVPKDSAKLNAISQQPCEIFLTKIFSYGRDPATFLNFLTNYFSFPIKTDACRNCDDGVPAHTAKLARRWIVTNCSQFISIR